MAVTWPSTLPQNAFQGCTKSAEPNVIVSKVDSGPAKVRARSTYERDFQSTPIELTGAQVAVFETFWGNINKGVDPFEWVDVITGASATFRFRDGKKPTFTNYTPAVDPDKRRYQGLLELERLS